MVKKRGFALRPLSTPLTLATTRRVGLIALMIAGDLFIGAGFAAAQSSQPHAPSQTQAQTSEAGPSAATQDAGAAVQPLKQAEENKNHNAAPSEEASRTEQKTNADAEAGEVENAAGERRSLTEVFDQTLAPINSAIARVLFFDLAFGAFEAHGVTMPFLVVFLAAGAIFFTLWHGFINIRGFRHAFDVVRGKYSSAGDEGDIPPFRALTSALSATVGLGNIAGVAVAMYAGGAGALFWMMVLGLFGMTAKFHETTLAQMFRQKNPDGTVSGGPMFYLDRGLRQLNPAAGALGKVLAVVFAIFTMAASIGGGNMFQSNQAFEGFYSQFVAEPSLAEKAAMEMSEPELRGYLSDTRLKRLRDKYDEFAGMPIERVRQEVASTELMPLVDLTAIEKTLDPEALEADRRARDRSRSRFAVGFGILLATLVAIVVIGGITRIGAATSRIVPSMCLLYMAGCLVVIAMNYYRIPDLIGRVFTQAFAWESAYGGLIGVLIIGFQRAAFSSEAGLGSSAIAHSAAQSAEPVREGFVASLEPFIDTIVICFLTGMTVLVTNAYIAPQFDENAGTSITLYAFQQTGPLQGWFPAVLSVSIVLFAFSTMISWCYYGERGWQYLFGLRSVVVFRVLFVLCVFAGAVLSMTHVITFADLMLLSMALPNMIGGVILAPRVKRELSGYWRRYRAGTFSATSRTASENVDAGEGI